MKRTTKAVMLSAFGYPGSGHWYLGKKRSAAVIMVISIVALCVVISGMWSQMNLLAEQIVQGDAQLEIGALMELMAQQGDTEQSGFVRLATISMGIVWCFAIVDAWRLARKSLDR